MKLHKTLLRAPANTCSSTYITAGWRSQSAPGNPPSIHPTADGVAAQYVLWVEAAGFRVLDQRCYPDSISNCEAYTHADYTLLRG